METLIVVISVILFATAIMMVLSVYGVFIDKDKDGIPDYLEDKFQDLKKDIKKEISKLKK
tara:strand:- start:327 stop:506 length:180 start_codon:yes stop_codon:yes gene_type:complete